MRLLIGLLVAASFAVMVSACGGGDSEGASPSATATARASGETAAPEAASLTATATAEAPTATLEPTETPAPTETPVPPTDTPVPPTDTPVPPTDTPVPPTATNPAPVIPTQAPSGGAQSLYLTAQGLKFSPATLYAVSGGSVTITLTNQDTVVPHNVQVSGLGTSETCQGPCTATLSFLTPPPGSYGFMCTVHPYMTGTLVVQ